VKASTLPSRAPGQAAVGAGSAAGKNPRPLVAAAPSAALIGGSSPIWHPRRARSAGPCRDRLHLGPSARGKGTGTAAVAALVRWLAAVLGMRRIAGVTGPRTRFVAAARTPGFPPHGPLADTGEVRYTLSLGERPIPIPGAARQFLHAPNYVHPCACWA